VVIYFPHFVDIFDSICVLRTLPAVQYHLRQTFNNPKAMPEMFRYLRD